MLPSLGGCQMEYAFSLVLQDFVHATEVSYEDIREFIIICPSCHEHVRKIGSEVLSRQYFAHFPERETRLRATGATDHQREIRHQAGVAAWTATRQVACAI